MSSSGQSFNVAAATGHSKVNQATAMGYAEHVTAEYVTAIAYAEHVTTEHVTTGNRSGTVQSLEVDTNRVIDLRTQGMITRRVCDDIIQNIKLGKHWTSLVGNAGDGKTTLGYMVLKKLRDDGFKVFVVNSPDDCRSVMRMDYNKCVVMLNDVFGSIDFDSSACKQWKQIIEEFLEDSKRREEFKDLLYIHMLFICRSYILMKAKSEFSRHEEEIFSAQALFDLGKRSKEDELNKILTYHLQKKNITDVDDDSKRRAIKGKHGIPHASELYSEIRSKGNCIDICEFFKSPLKFLNITMKVFVENCDTLNLFRLLSSSGGPLRLAKIEDEQEREHIRKTAKPLHASYVKNRLDCFSWAHPSILESFVVIYGRTNPEFIIKNCDFSVINRRVKVKERGSEDCDEYLLLQPTETVLEHLCARFKQELLNGHYDVLGHTFCHREEFLEILLDTCLCQEDVENEVADKLHIDKRGSWQRGTLLQAAVLVRNVAAIKSLLCRNPNVNERDWMLGTALHIAVIQFESEGSTDIQIIELLINAKADVNLTDGGGYTPLHRLCRNRSVTTELLVALLKEGANVNGCDADGYTPLHELCENTSITTELLAQLLKAGANVNVRGGFRDTTPLHRMCENTSVTAELVVVLLKAGADVNSRKRLGFTALHTLCGNTSVTVEVLAVLLEGGADVNTCSCSRVSVTPLCSLCLNPIVTAELLAVLLKAGASVQRSDTDSHTPLHHLCENTNVTTGMLAALLKAGADAHCRDELGFTPLDCLRVNLTVAGDASEMIQRAKALAEIRDQ